MALTTDQKLEYRNMTFQIFTLMAVLRAGEDPTVEDFKNVVDMAAMAAMAFKERTSESDFYDQFES